MRNINLFSLQPKTKAYSGSNQTQWIKINKKVDENNNPMSSNAYHNHFAVHCFISLLTTSDAILLPANTSKLPNTWSLLETETKFKMELICSLFWCVIRRQQRKARVPRDVNSSGFCPIIMSHDQAHFQLDIRDLDLGPTLMDQSPDPTQNWLFIWKKNPQCRWGSNLRPSSCITYHMCCMLSSVLMYNL